MTTIAGGPRELVLPPVRGPWTASLYRLLTAGDAAVPDPVIPACHGDAAVLEDDDLQMALYLCYELHYAGIVGVDPEMEWSPLVLMFRAALEARFERALRSLAGGPAEACSSVGEELQRLVREDEGPRSRDICRPRRTWTSSAST